MPKCQRCDNPAVVRRQLTGEALCGQCFCKDVEEDVHRYIQEKKLINEGQTVVIGVSGGKDSSVLLAILHKLIYERYQECYKGVQLKLCAVDEGIKGYRDESLEVVKELQKEYGHDIVVMNFQDEFGRTLDHLMTQELTCSDLEDAQNASLGRSACSYCGIMRRACLSRGAAKFGDAALLATGHNADDVAETALLNLVRGDFGKLKRCADDIADLKVGNPKIKPLSKQPQKDVVLYAHFSKTKYFSTECPYAVAAQRNAPRNFLRFIEKKHPRAPILTQKAVADLARGAPATVQIKKCPGCGAPVSTTRCQACELKNATTAAALKAVLKLKAQ